MSRAGESSGKTFRCECDCCPRPAREGCAEGGWSRRAFLTAAGGAAAMGSALSSLGLAAGDRRADRPRQQPIRLPLGVQPVFNCDVYPRKEATSWRVTGAIRDEEDLRQEEKRIRRDLAGLTASAGFPLEVRPLVTVRTVEEAAAVAKGDHDVLIMYAARRNRPVLEALTVPGKWTLMFVRHRSGPLYYMYIGAHTHFLRKTQDHFSQPGMDVHDVVVDDHGEILWRLRALAGLKNVLGRRVVAVGGPAGWGVGGKDAPQRARQTWKMDLCTVTYPELGKLIEKAREDAALVKRCRAEAAAYLEQQGVTLETSRESVERAFLLTEVFRDLLDEARADAITISDCMSTIMPISQTTACLPLSLLNDEGYLAFCESDFVVIPAGILLHHIARTPVFFCNPSMPHKCLPTEAHDLAPGNPDLGLLTVSHCTAPRKMDGKRPEPVRILTHYESDFGAAPKVEMAKGQGITVVDPDFAGRRWLGFSGRILDTPFFPICRTQLDVEIHGDWERLAEEIRGFHWMVAYGNYLREMGYAVRKAGLKWLQV